MLIVMKHSEKLWQQHQNGGTDNAAENRADPPSTAITTNSIERRKLDVSGVTKPSNSAK